MPSIPTKCPICGYVVLSPRDWPTCDARLLAPLTGAGCGARYCENCGHSFAEVGACPNLPDCSRRLVKT